MRVRYTERAAADLDHIFDFLHERNPSAATSFLIAARNRIGQLEIFPFVGASTRLPDIRYLMVLRYPYKVYYRVRGSTVSILHIRHTSRMPWRGGED